MERKRILRYIKETLDYGLFFPRKKCDEPVLAYVDPDWANDSDRKSFTGYLIQVYGAMVTWVTRKQATIALSSTESEYVALATAATDIIWFKKLLPDLGINCDEPVTVFEDNQSCIHLLRRWEHRRLKHIDVKYNFVKELCNNRQLDVVYVSTEDQTADILTKGLTGERFVKLRSCIGVCII